jgi:hypothetical protein
MIRRVNISFEVDCTQYEKAEDSDEGAVDLAIEMLKRDADFPKTVVVTCEYVTKITDCADEVRAFPILTSSGG